MSSQISEDKCERPTSSIFSASYYITSKMSLLQSLANYLSDLPQSSELPMWHAPSYCSKFARNLKLPDCLQDQRSNTKVLLLWYSWQSWSDLQWRCCHSLFREHAGNWAANISTMGTFGKKNSFKKDHGGGSVKLKNNRQIFE